MSWPTMRQENCPCEGFVPWSGLGFHPLTGPRKPERDIITTQCRPGSRRSFLPEMQSNLNLQFIKSEQCHYASTMYRHTHTHMLLCKYVYILYTYIFRPIYLHYLYILYRGYVYIHIYIHTILSTFPPTMMEVENGSLGVAIFD